MMKFYRTRQELRPTTPVDPVSLQDQIHAVQEMRATSPTPRRGSGGKLAVGGVVLAAIVALWQFGPRFGWGPGGRGAGNGSGQGVMAPASPDDSARLAASRQLPTPQRPLRVTIDGNRYLIGGKEVDLDGISKLIPEIPAGDGPAVEVKREGTSRVKAEQDLKAVIDKDQAPATWMPPLE